MPYPEVSEIFECLVLIEGLALKETKAVNLITHHILIGCRLLWGP